MEEGEAAAAPDPLAGMTATEKMKWARAQLRPGAAKPLAGKEREGRG